MPPCLTPILLFPMLVLVIMSSVPAFLILLVSYLCALLVRLMFKKRSILIVNLLIWLIFLAVFLLEILLCCVTVRCMVILPVCRVLCQRLTSW